MHNLTAFEKQQFMNVETFRKSGIGVRTPVWFVEYNGELCFTSEVSSGKVKRLKRDPAVMVAPCRPDGALLGDWYPGRARFMSAEETVIVKKVYARKYGVLKLFFDLMGIFRKGKRVFIAVQLNP